jgi:hypothetical protein
MTRERVKELFPIFQAFAEGKDIQFFNVNEWCLARNPSFYDDKIYRIKPEKKFVPFDYSDNIAGKIIKCEAVIGRYLIIRQVLSSLTLSDGNMVTYQYLFDHYTFEDGTPCGKDIEE